MRFSQILAATGAVAAIACVTAAVAADHSHVMTVRLPDGSVEHVRYVGDTPPRILIADPAAAEDRGAMDPIAMMTGAPGFDTPGFDPFADMQRISAMMDAQADAMMRHAAAVQQAAMTQGATAAHAGGQTTMVALPEGSQQFGPGQFSYVSTSTVNGKTCTVSMRSAPSAAKGQAPQMLRTVSGDGCTAVQQQTGPHAVALPATPAVPPTPHTVSLPATRKAPVAPQAPAAPAPDSI